MSLAEELLADLEDLEEDDTIPDNTDAPVDAEKEAPNNNGKNTRNFYFCITTSAVV